MKEKYAAIVKTTKYYPAQGHGYPAYTGEEDEIIFFDNLEELKRHVEHHQKERVTYIKYVVLKPEVKVNIEVDV